MPIDRDELTRWIFGSDEARRYTQDSPVLPDVWLAYGAAPDDPVDLLLTPHAQSSAAAVAAALAEVLGDHRQETRLAYTNSYAAASLNFAQLIRYVLPLSHWWHAHVWRAPAKDL